MCASSAPGAYFEAGARERSFGSDARAFHDPAADAARKQERASAGFAAIKALERQAKAFDSAYGAGAKGRFVTAAALDYVEPCLGDSVSVGKGSLTELVAFLQGDD